MTPWNLDAREPSHIHIPRPSRRAAEAARQPQPATVIGETTCEAGWCIQVGPFDAHDAAA